MVRLFILYLPNQILIIYLELHKYGFIHTDIKPDNIVIVDDSVVSTTQMNMEGNWYTKVCSHPIIHPLFT